MSKTAFKLDPELNVTGKGTLTAAAQRVGQLSLGNCVAKGVAAYQNIDREYRKALANDGRIVGTERADILEEIDMFIDILLLMMRILDEERRKENVTLIENRHSGFTMTIREHNSLWEAQGKLNVFMVRPVKNFRTIYNNKLAPQIIELLKNYGQALEDGVLDVAEMQTLKQDVKQVLYYGIFLRFQVEQCLVND